MRTSILLCSCASIALVAGCVVEGDRDVCRQAAEHVAECSGAVAAPAAQSCDGQAALLAEQALTTSCAELAQRGKADAFSNPVSLALCVSLGIPIFVTGGVEGDACCFDHNCAGELACRKHSCVKPAGAGASCERNGHCRAGLACVFGKCATPRAAGQSCGDPGDCASGLTCGPKKTCVPPGATGQSCGANEHCHDRCIAGRCAPRASAGGACDGGDDFDCDLGLVCVQGSCAPRPASGGACDPASPFQCEMDETCWQGRCEARHSQGGGCKSMHDCVFGLFCRSGKCAE
jgi:hypothetical protein